MEGVQPVPIPTHIYGVTSSSTVNDNTIAGVILMRVVLKADYGRIFARTILLDGVAQKKCMQIKTALNRKVDIFADFDCESYLSIEVVSIKPAYRRRGSLPFPPKIYNLTFCNDPSF